MPGAGQGAAGAARPIPPTGSGAASSGSRGHTNNSWQQAGKEASSAGGQAGTAGPPPATAQCFRCPSPGCRSPGAPRAPSSWEGRGGARQPLAGVRSVKRRQNPQQHSPSSVPVCCPQGFKSTPWGSDRGDGAPQDPPRAWAGRAPTSLPCGETEGPPTKLPSGVPSPVPGPAAPCPVPQFPQAGPLLTPAWQRAPGAGRCGAGWAGLRRGQLRRGQRAVARGHSVGRPREAQREAAAMASGSRAAGGPRGSGRLRSLLEAWGRR